MTDKQKARAWDALKIAANNTLEHAGPFETALKEATRSFLGMMASIEAKVLEADSARSNP